MFEFEVGDRILYFAGYHIHSRSYIGKKGTVLCVGAIPHRKERQPLTIQFDCDPPRDTREMYRANLEPANETPDWEI